MLLDLAWPIKTFDEIETLPADGNGKVEEGEHPTPGLLDEHVGDDGGRNGGVAGLADAHHGAGAQEPPKVQV